MPTEACAYDKVFSVNVVQFFADRAAAFRKIYSVLKPNGVAATTYMPRKLARECASAGKMADEIKFHMEVAGFAYISIVELPLVPAPAICVIGKH